MGFTDRFTGNTVQPSRLAYSPLALSTDTELVWPLEAQSGGTIAPFILDVTPASGGLTLALPSAKLAGVGQDILITNLSLSLSFTLLDFDDNTLLSLSPGVSYYLYLQDNSTTAGTWGSLVFGGTVAAVNPASLAGPGLMVYSSTQLATAMTAVSRPITWTMLNSNRATLNLYVGGAGSANLQSAASAGNNWWCAFYNNGTGSLTIDPSGGELINGAATLVLAVGEGAIIVCDGTAWYTASLSRNVISSITRLALSTVGGTTVLTSLQATYTIIDISGVLASNAIIEFPAVVGRWFVRNACSGAYTVTVRVAGGDPGLEALQAQQQIFWSDGTNMVNAVTTTPIAPTSFAAGLVNAPSLYLTSFPQTGIYFPTTTSMAFAASGSEVFRMAASGLLVNGVSLTDASNNIPWARISAAALPQIQAYTFGM